MDGLIRTYEKLCAWVDEALKFITITMFVVMTTIVVLGILSRFSGLFDILWSEEVGRYLMIWMGFLGAVMALRRGQHIGVTYLLEKLPRFIVTFIILAVQALCLYFLVFMVKEGIGMMGVAARTEQLSPLSDIPVSIVYAIIPLSGALMILEMILAMISMVRKIGRPAN